MTKLYKFSTIGYVGRGMGKGFGDRGRGRGWVRGGFILGEVWGYFRNPLCIISCLRSSEIFCSARSLVFSYSRSAAVCCAPLDQYLKYHVVVVVVVG